MIVLKTFFKKDRQPKNVLDSFHQDESPKYATCWYSLSEANQNNSCL